MSTAILLASRKAVFVRGVASAGFPGDRAIVSALWTWQRSPATSDYPHRQDQRSRGFVSTRVFASKESLPMKKRGQRRSEFPSSKFATGSLIWGTKTLLW